MAAVRKYDRQGREIVDEGEPAGGMASDIAEDAQDKRAAVCMAGIALLIIGSLSPLIAVSSGSSQTTINFFGNGAGDGWVVLVLAGIAGIFLSMQKYRWILIVGVLNLVLLALDFFRVSSAVAGLSTPGTSIGYSWGWLLLVVGAIVLILVPWAKPREYE